MRPAEQQEAVPYLVITPCWTVDDKVERADPFPTGSDTVTHDRRRHDIDRNVPATTSKTPFGVDEVNEQLLVKGSGNRKDFGCRRGSRRNNDVDRIPHARVRVMDPRRKS